MARYFFCIKASGTPLADDEGGQEFATRRLFATKLLRPHDRF